MSDAESRDSESGVSLDAPLPTGRHGGSITDVTAGNIIHGSRGGRSKRPTVDAAPRAPADEPSSDGDYGGGAEEPTSSMLEAAPDLVFTVSSSQGHGGVSALDQDGSSSVNHGLPSSLSASFAFGREDFIGSASTSSIAEVYNIRVKVAAASIEFARLFNSVPPSAQPPFALGHQVITEVTTFLDGLDAPHLSSIVLERLEAFHQFVLEQSDSVRTVSLSLTGRDNGALVSGEDFMDAASTSSSLSSRSVTVIGGTGTLEHIRSDALGDPAGIMIDLPESHLNSYERNAISSLRSTSCGSAVVTTALRTCAIELLHVFQSGSGPAQYKKYKEFVEHVCNAAKLDTSLATYYGLAPFGDMFGHPRARGKASSNTQLPRVTPVISDDELLDSYHGAILRALTSEPAIPDYGYSQDPNTPSRVHLQIPFQELRKLYSRQLVSRIVYSIYCDIFDNLTRHGSSIAPSVLTLLSSFNSDYITAHPVLEADDFDVGEEITGCFAVHHLAIKGLSCGFALLHWFRGLLKDSIQSEFPARFVSHVCERLAPVGVDLLHWYTTVHASAAQLALQVPFMEAPPKAMAALGLPVVDNRICFLSPGAVDLWIYLSIRSAIGHSQDQDLVTTFLRTHPCPSTTANPAAAATTAMKALLAQMARANTSCDFFFVTSMTGTACGQRNCRHPT